MNRLKLVPLAIISLAFSSCASSDGTASSGGFDPLASPGGAMSTTSASNSKYKAGQFVRATMDNTAFFKVRPNGNAQSDKLLPVNTSMKMISESDSYVKVELDDGEVGFVPSMMVDDSSAPIPPPVIQPGESQVYPPLPVTGLGEPLPVVDPNALPPE